MRTSSTLNITIILWSVGILSFCYSGTRPDRTIVFCAWGAEEHGLIGSTEWVEVLFYTNFYNNSSVNLMLHFRQMKIYKKTKYSHWFKKMKINI